MNARTALVLLATLTLAGNAIAETETKESEGSEVAQVRPADPSLQAALNAAPVDMKPHFFHTPDFRNSRVTAGMLDRRSSPAFKVLGAGMFIASGADLASTELALRRPGIEEANPFQRNGAVRAISHAAAPALMYYVTDRLRDGGRPKLALLARIGFTVGYGYIVMHNLRTAAAAP